MSNSFLVAGGVGVLANYAFFSQYTPVTVDLFLKEVATVIQPLSALKVILPALFGFLGGTLLLLIWNYLKVRVVRFLLEYDGWFLHPKRPINKVWYMVLVALLGTKNKGLGNYQDYLPSLPVPPLEQTAKKYLNSVRPFLTMEEYEDTKSAVKEFVQKDAKKLQWLLKFRSWRMRNWISEWWIEFIYLRQRTPICFNSNYYATCQPKLPTTSQLDRAATFIYKQMEYSFMVKNREVENAMASKVVAFCSENYQFLTSTIRIPGVEKDELICYGRKNPTHYMVYRQGRFYTIEGISPVTGKLHSPVTLKHQLEQVVAMAGDVRDETGVQNFTSLPRTKWAEIHEIMMKSPVNKRSLELIGSSINLMVLETESPDMEDLTSVAQLLFHGDGYSRWFDKSFTAVVCPNGVLGANAEHSPLDATVCGQMWEFILCEEQYDDEGKCIQMYPGETPSDTPTPTQLKWEVDDLRDELADATAHLSRMIRDSDMQVVLASYGKRIPKKFKLSPDGWFQMCLQLAYYRLHKKTVLTYESATTRLYFKGRTETIRPVSDNSVAFVKAMDSHTHSKEDIKELLKKAIEYQYQYKVEAMRGLGVDRHLFGLYIIAKGLKMNPMPKMFTDKAFNFSFLLSTSQTPVKTTDRWSIERSTCLGGFGTVCDEGYGISYIVVGEDQVNFSVHSKHSCPETSSTKMCRAIYQAFEDMKDLFEL